MRTSFSRLEAPKRNRSGVIQRGPSVSYSTTRYWTASLAVRIPPAGFTPTARPVAFSKSRTASSMTSLLGVGDQSRIDAQRRDRRDRGITRLGMDRLRREAPDLARGVAALEGRQIDHPDREVEGPQLRGLLDRAALQRVDAQLDSDL